jgi:hemolysin type calcium-binding protein
VRFRALPLRAGGLRKNPPGDADGGGLSAKGGGHDGSGFGSSQGDRDHGSRRTARHERAGGLSGGKGNDRLNGGKGRDRLFGGAGNDRLNSADGRKDARVAGGPGSDSCRIDAIDLSIVRGCASITVVPGGSTGGGGGGGPGGGGAAGLVLATASGLRCGSRLPTCIFTMNGGGADSEVGTVTGAGGVTGGGGAVSETGDAWTAAGSYGCMADGFLRVAIGSELLDVPVECTTP